MGNALTAVNLHGGTTSLDEIGIYSVTFRYRDGQSGKMPNGWVGMFYGSTGISCTPYGEQNGKQCFLIHPPWRNGTGVTDQTFKLKLPPAKEIELEFSIAMATFVIGKSDGVTFRCFVDGRKLLDKNKSDANWSSYRFDLTPYAGHTITLRFEADPGPKNDPSFDYGFWGNRRIVITGAPLQKDMEIGRANPYPLSELSTPSPYITPGVIKRNIIAARIAPDESWWEISVPGVRDIYYRVYRNNPLRVRIVNTISGRSNQDFDLSDGVSVVLVAPNGDLISDTDSRVTRSVHDLTLNARAVSGFLRYEYEGRTVDLHFTLAGMGQGLVETFHSDQPYIAELSVGGITNAAFRRQVAIPYLGSVTYLPASGLYAYTILDWTKSRATSFDGTNAMYGALTDGTRNPLSETAYLATSSDVDAVLPNPPNPPSPYRRLIDDKVILDVWGGRFDDNATWLRELATYDLTHFATIAHDWQHGGYDNELPNVLPAQAALGGNAGMEDWVSSAIKLGELIGLHENYIDFYPNATLYNQKDVALQSDGKPIPAWKNIIQSYALKPIDVLKYAKLITTQVEDTFHENAGFIDVYSSAPPWFDVDMQAGLPNAGEFRARWKVDPKLWQLFRDVHHGPIFGEGNNHWYWSGLLDGVEAQFGTGVPSNSGQTAPLFVNFDLLKIHPLQFNHGMGYLERWLSSGYSGTWYSNIPDMKTLDQYRMQEVAYGHAGFVANQVWRNLPFVWNEHNLMWPLTQRYATADATEISYPVGDRMVDASEAAADNFAFDRVMVKYSDGLTIWANSRDAHWIIRLPGLNETVTLPQFGWVAMDHNFLAGTWLRDGVVSDMNRSPDRIYVNARTSYTAPPLPLQVHPYATSFRNLGGRKFEIVYRWRVDQAIPPGNWVVFTHFVGPGGSPEGIIFQPGQPVPAVNEWKPGETVSSAPADVSLPPDLKDGVYELCTGIFDPTTGDRLSLECQPEGVQRYLLGKMIVSDSGNQISFTPPEPYRIPEQIFKHINQNRAVLDFDGIKTNGSVLLERRSPDEWVMTIMPRDEPFSFEIATGALGRPGSRITAETLNAADEPIGAAKVTHLQGDWYRIEVGQPGAAHYRITLSGR